ncbi:TPA: divalent-cation tolerance protein CutA [archaeon]|uniref:Divalent-cation tolerance protein CutA n=1 Tax=Candidatus Naiadarchaeum limnaeum TaxID=2756139 RepID=A0A832UP03_9ARCH|nr:divalent-cation tolerance protein CutA [Candidatus Naiadarchaeales archaeon SRR2090153.bin1042]HIK00734.1 divalent-cation tolerance protein CutA [Candidatus Naiadarchaeum limnaeum]
MLLIYVPCKNEDEAKKIGSILVEERLVCCANIIPKMDSLYIENEKVKETGEALLLMKTIANYEIVRKRVEELHSYEVPAIAAFDLAEINHSYNEWAISVQKKKGVYP